MRGTAERVSSALVLLLFNVLHLFAQLIDRDFKVNADARELDIAGLRAQGIGFAIELLTNEIELATDRLALF